MAHHDGLERRAHPRIPSRFKVMAKSKGALNKIWKTSRLRDISLGGCFFILRDPLPWKRSLSCRSFFPRWSGP